LRPYNELKIKLYRMIYLIFILTMVLGMVVQAMLTNRFEKYSKVPLGMSGAEVAEKMLRDNGIYDVKVTHVSGHLTDHYNPATKTVNLSDGVYSSRSVAAAAVAAHECGHALQHARAYAPLKMRSALVPIVQFSSNIVQWVLLAGIILINSFPALLWFGIFLFATTTAFSFITLPVEINASRRAVTWLSNAGIVDYRTQPMAVDALKWAAYTYVIAAISSLATLLYYIGIARSRD
jgi:Zn-dependent membrane protease YugP